MHEMSIVSSMLNIIRQEMARHEKTRLLSVKVVHGRLANVVPEAMSFAFEHLCGEEFNGARLVLEEKPLTVSCRICKHVFSPEAENIAYMPCPECGEEFGHEILSGKELYVDNIEAE